MTLKEVVESGRRWRWIGGDSPSPWYGPGLNCSQPWSASVVLSSDFEIEPKPREWNLHIPRPGGKDEWIESYYSRDRVKATGHIEDKERDCFHLPAADLIQIRVHDADACDRLHKNCDVPR